MTKRQQLRKGRVKMPRPTEVHDATPTKSEARRKALQTEMDAVLDDIDAVLEENAETFVAQYVQKGGQ